MLRLQLLIAGLLVATALGDIIVPQATTFSEVQKSFPAGIVVPSVMTIGATQPLRTPKEGLYAKAGVLRSSAQFAQGIKPRENEVLLVSQEMVFLDNTEIVISKETKFLTILAVNMTVGKNVKITYEKNNFRHLAKPPTPRGFSPPHGDHWSIWCKHRSPGATGRSGINGVNGAIGADAAGLRIIVWSIDRLPDIDLKGQDGQRGQDGGNGGAGQRGRRGKAASTGFIFCKNRHGEGCNGGPGGIGGSAGGGGAGGKGGFFSISTSAESLLKLDGHTVKLGPGKGGPPGIPGDGGPGGDPGDRGLGHKMCPRGVRQKGDKGLGGGVGARGASGPNGQSYLEYSGGKPNYVRKELPEKEATEFHLRWAAPRIKCTYAKGSSCRNNPGVGANELFEVEGENFLPDDVLDFFIGGFNVILESKSHGPNLLEFELPEIVTSRRYVHFVIRRKGSESRGSLFRPGPRDGVSNLGIMRVKK